MQKRTMKKLILHLGGGIDRANTLKNDATLQELKTLVENLEAL
jgi:hypothetical protein